MVTNVIFIITPALLPHLCATVIELKVVREWRGISWMDNEGGN